MAVLTLNTDYFVTGVSPNAGIIILEVACKNTVDAADTLTVDLTANGGSATGLIGVLGFKHTTDNSVMVQEQPTTSVSAGVLTLTVPAGTDNDPRYYIIYCRSNANP